MEYQGWTNYPTWAVNLWLTNEYPGIAPGATAEQLEQTVQDIAESAELPGMLSDLLSWAIDQVNWNEIAENNRE